ncbi:MAG: MFS transporter [Chloroflexi bacterium]|nr:MFS transporter [Chloroflexota bacterium]
MMSEDIDTLKESEKEKMIFSEDDFAPAESHEEEDCGNNWTGGLVLIGIGAAFLFINITHLSFNWWILFILIPGVVKLVNGAKYYQRDGRFSDRVRNDFVWGLILILVAGTFLFGFGWGMVWPVFLIIFGLGALLTGVFGK